MCLLVPVIIFNISIIDGSITNMEMVIDITPKVFIGFFLLFMFLLWHSVGFKKYNNLRSLQKLTTIIKFCRIFDFE